MNEGSDVLLLSIEEDFRIEKNRNFEAGNLTLKPPEELTSYIEVPSQQKKPIERKYNCIAVRKPVYINAMTIRVKVANNTGHVALRDAERAT